MSLPPPPVLPPVPPSAAVLLFPPPLPEYVTPPAAASPPPAAASPPPAAERPTTAVERPRPAPSNNSTTLVALGVGIGIGGTIVLVCVGIFVIWYRRNKRKRLGSLPQVSKDDRFHGPQYNQQPVPPSTSTLIGSRMNTVEPIPQTTPDKTSLNFTKTTFTYEELAFATDNFSSTNLLGQGGFGYVHKGVLHDGKVVAIKQLKLGSGQGEREFQAEVETISRVNHKHLVSLHGHCISGIQRLLVYEYVPNQTLEFHLHGKGETPMNWVTRIKVALGSAKGLAYLHEDCHPKIIHRDIKSANILIDEDFEAKVADFGLARFYSETDTHVSTRVMGTFGYLAPEYALTGKLTEKSDVFSFGVVLLELITGRRPIDKSQNYLDDNIVDWARPLLSQALETNNFDSVADPKLLKDYDSNEMARMVGCASVCVRHLARRRPKMSEILGALEGKLSLGDLTEDIQPGHSAIYDSHGSSDYDVAYDTKQYREDLIKFKKMALENVELTTSECSGPTSEFGPRPSGSSSECLRNTQQTHH